jgi:hypothetical protein
MLFTRRGYDKILVPVLVLGAFLYFSIQPIFRVRPDMPREFFDAPSSWSPQMRASEEKIAQAYWNCVVKNVQWKYGYGYNLPPDPPAEFTIATLSPAWQAADSANRVRYWHKLQGVWYVSSIWSKSYEWNLSWLTDSLQSAYDWVRNRLWKLFSLP